MNAVLYSESLASGGGGADMRFLCDYLQVRVDSLTAGSLSFEGAVTAARAAGLSSDRANLLIFVDGTLGGSCGISLRKPTVARRSTTAATPAAGSRSSTSPAGRPRPRCTRALT